MKTDEIKELFSLFEAAASELEGVECWSARELQELLGYTKWENFEKVIQKAKDACKNAGEEIDYHFPDIRKMIVKGKGAKDEIDDILLTRYACYLIAQNGDSRKEEIAFAQNYFDVKSIKAKDLAAEMTGLNVQNKDLKGQSKIENEHIENNMAVRNMLTQRGIVPENLSPAEDVKKLQRKLDGDEKKVLKDTKKKK